jgi:hypothetical protein
VVVVAGWSGCHRYHRVGVNVSVARGVVLVVACWSVSVVLPPENFMLECVS